MQIKIENKIIGEEQPCFIIAEAGVNHNGDIEKAFELIDIAEEARADAVKFQTWITEELITPDLKQVDYQLKNTRREESQFNMLKKIELDFDEFRELKKYADKKKIIFLSTPADLKSADFLEELNVPAYKIGSGELTNVFMLEKIAVKGKPIILSTGMATLKEIKETIDILQNSGNNDLILLHCTSQYPCAYKDVNLKAMITLKETFNTLVGYSDHTEGLIVPVIAISLGANVLEKHFTYDKNAEGPDHKCSLNRLELKEMVKKIRLTEMILGKAEKNPTVEELKSSNLIRKVLVAKTDILKGTGISKNMITAKRANGNLEPKEILNIIDKVAQKNIKKNHPINKNDVK